MNWEAVGAMAEAIGALGVIITLVYLATQIRSNTKATRIASFQTTTDSLNQVNLLLAGDQSLSAMFVESFQDDIEWGKEAETQWSFLLLALYRIFESAYFQRHEGLLESQSWTRYDHSLRSSLAARSTMKWWLSEQFGFTEDFTNYVNEIIQNMEHAS